MCVCVCVCVCLDRGRRIVDTTHHHPKESSVQSGAVLEALLHVPVLIPPPMNCMEIDEQSAAHEPCETLK